MLARAQAILAVLVVAILPGCFGASQNENKTHGLLSSGDVGYIVGVVVDDLIEPVSNVSVALDGSAIAMTDEAGEFSFADVYPGDHQIAASTAGYTDASANVQVMAGQATKVTLKIVRLAIAEAYSETRIQAGTILCVVGFRTGTPNTTSVTVCSIGSLATNTTFIETPFRDWRVGSLYGDLVGFWAETTWRSTQALGTGMRVRWFVQNRPLQTSSSATADYQQGDLGAGEGRAPLGLRIPIDRARTSINTRAQSGTGDTICPPDKPEFECWLLSGHFASAAALATGNYNVGVTIQQRYDDYLTLFHKGEFPTSFTALADQ